MDTRLAVDLSGPMEDALGAVARFVPALMLFLVIVLVGWLIAIALRSLVDKVLERVGFDRAVERGGVGRALARTKYDASDLVAQLVYYAVLLLTLQLGFGVWGPNPVSDLIHDVVTWLPRAAVAIVIVVVAAAIARAVRELASNALGGLSYGRLVANVAWAFIVGLGTIAALNQIGVATSVTTPVLIAVLATVGGVVVVGVGGGLIRPMQRRWEGWLDRLGEELPAVSARLRAAAEGRAGPGPYAGARPAGLHDDATMIVPLGRPVQPADGEPAGHSTDSPTGPIHEDVTGVIPRLPPDAGSGNARRV